MVKHWKPSYNKEYLIRLCLCYVICITAYGSAKLLSTFILFSLLFIKVQMKLVTIQRETCTLINIKAFQIYLASISNQEKTLSS